jgi:hypothetical protein
MERRSIIFGFVCSAVERGRKVSPSNFFVETIGGSTEICDAESVGGDDRRD